MAHPVLFDVDSRGIATITLNRAERHNAFDAEIVERLTASIERCTEEQVRLVILTGAGKSFSAGADIDHMRSLAAADTAENRADAENLAKLLAKLDALPRPVIAKVNGAAIGGGVGLVACCDIAVASERARFGLSEVRLGLAPAVISPYVIAAIGQRAARRYFLSGERFDATRAKELGLVHETADANELGRVVNEVSDALLAGAPRAQRKSKELIRAISRSSWPADAETISHTIDLIAELRAAPEGREGLAAFLEKRSPDWPG